MEAITTKGQMYQLLKSGQLGNVFFSWSSWQAVVDSGYRGLLSVRSRTVSHPIRLYDRPFDEVAAKIASLPNDLEFFEATPVETRVIQGELQRGTRGLEFFYSLAKEHMRPALEKSGVQAYGLQAQMVLRHFVPHADVEHLEHLLDTYDGHVIEFTTFSVPVGVLRKRTAIWECRRY